MHRTPTKQTDNEEQSLSAPSHSETDQEQDAYRVTRRPKRKHSPDTDAINASITFKLNSLKHDISEHMTKLFTVFQENQDAKFSALLAEINEVKSDVKELRQSTTVNEQKVDFLASQLETTSKEIGELASSQEASNFKINQLEEKLEAINRQACAYKVEIRNVPSRPQESVEDILKITENLMKVLKIEIQNTEIKNVRRLPGKPDAPRPIVVEFASTMMKNKVIREARQYNKNNQGGKLNTSHLYIEGAPRPVYVGENLTYNAKGLFYKAREHAKKHSYTFCWTNNGLVYLRKAEDSISILIKNEEQLLNIDKIE